MVNCFQLTGPAFPQQLSKGEVDLVWITLRSQRGNRNITTKHLSRQRFKIYSNKIKTIKMTLIEIRMKD